MGERVRRMTAREIEAILARFGFVLVSQQGSHRKWRHEMRRLQVVVPYHAGRTLPIGTQMAILKAAEVPRSEYTG